MVAVGVDGPMGDYHIGFFGFDEGKHFGITLFVDLGIAVDLGHKHRADTHHFACSARFGLTDSARLFVAFATDACLARGEIYRYYLYAHSFEFEDSATAHSFGVVGVSTDDEDFFVAFEPAFGSLDLGEG